MAMANRHGGNCNCLATRINICRLNETSPSMSFKNTYYEIANAKSSYYFGASICTSVMLQTTDACLRASTEDITITFGDT